MTKKIVVMAILALVPPAMAGVFCPETVGGHNLVLRHSRLLAGIPAIGFLGHTVERLSRSLNEARHWRPFNVRLCPALAGIELLKDGGYYAVELDPEARQPARFQFHRLTRT